MASAIKNVFVKTHPMINRNWKVPKYFFLYDHEKR